MASQMVPRWIIRTAFESGHKVLLDDLIGFGLSRPSLQATSPEDGHGLGHKARTGIKLKDLLPLPCRISSLLQQLPLGGSERLLPFIDPSRGKLPEKALRSMAILVLKQDQRFASAVCRSQNHHRPGMAHDLAKRAYPGGLQHPFGCDPEHRPTVNQAGRQNMGGLLSRTNWFGHRDNISDWESELEPGALDN